MENGDKEPVKEPLVNAGNFKKYVAYPALAVLAMYFAAQWLLPAFQGFLGQRVRMEELGPLSSRAKALGLTYEGVKADPAGSAGKPVAWCVQNRDSSSVFVDGSDAKRLTVSNYAAMPRVTGSKHEACVPMLLLVEEVPPGLPVRVFFKEEL